MGNPAEVHVRRFQARAIAACARAGIAILALVLLTLDSGLHPHPTLTAIGMSMVLLSAVVQLASADARVTYFEEVFAAIGGVFVIGFGEEVVNVVTLLWLAAVVTGALVRGAVSKTAAGIFIFAMVLPIALTGEMQANYIGFCVAAFALLLSGRAVGNEMNSLLDLARYEADHDALTGALSRFAFATKLDEALDKAGLDDVVTLTTLDLENFASVNSLYGHRAGDAVLITAVEQMRAFSGEDAVVGRIGGDEFAVFMRGADALRFAERLLESLSRGTGQATSINGRVGIAEAPADGRDASALMRAADVALRVAKRHGRKRISVYAGESLSEHGATGAAGMLSRLIGGEGIEMVVQPIFDVRNGGIESYEALARFQLGSTSSPLHWFALADEFRKRTELEHACLRAALKLMPELPDGANLCVNLSAPVLCDRRTLAIIVENCEPSRLVIEITEETLIRSDNEPLGVALTALREQGVKFSVDDTGAGYAGLRQITVVHPDYLKLDRSLVAELQENSDRCALVSAMVDYAERVGAMLVAEGVETEGELAMLRKLGVHLTQGFLLARPAEPWPELQHNLGHDDDDLWRERSRRVA